MHSSNVKTSYGLLCGLILEPKDKRQTHRAHHVVFEISSKDGGAKVGRGIDVKNRSNFR